MQKVATEHQALLDAEDKATTPWDEAMAHAKRVNNQAVATAEAGEALKEKIAAALSARYSEKGNHALVCAEGRLSDPVAVPGRPRVRDGPGESGVRIAAGGFG